MACLEEPDLSFRAPRAAAIISLYLGWLAGFFGLAAAFFTLGTATAGAVSVILSVFCVRMMKITPVQVYLTIIGHSSGLTRARGPDRETSRCARLSCDLCLYELRFLAATSQVSGLVVRSDTF